MKKTLALLLSLLMVFSTVAFAAPALDTVESAKEVPTTVSKAALNDVKSIVYSFNDGTYSEFTTFGSHSITGCTGGKLNIHRTGDSQGALYFNPTSPINGSVYKYALVKVSPEFGIKMYFANNASYAEAKTVTTTTIRNNHDGTYWRLLNLAANADWNTSYSNFMIAITSGAGDYALDEFVFTDDYSGYLSSLPYDGSDYIDSIIIKTTANAITTLDGEIALSVYTHTVKGNEELCDAKGLQYTTDSVDAQVTRNADGTLKLVGKVNGSITVTAIYTEGTEVFKASKTIPISGQGTRQSMTKIRYMSFGNSIMMHAKAESLGWYAEDMRGMASTALENDYVHRFVYYLGEKYGSENITFLKGDSVADFERTIANGSDSQWNSYTNKFAATAKAYQPNVITIQMGENGSGDLEHMSAAVRNIVGKLQDACPDAQIIMATSFWGGGADGAKLGAEQMGIPIADLAWLTASGNPDSGRNMAHAFFANWGVGQHPSDFGMDNIAKLYFEQFNLVSSTNEVRTIYTEKPTSLTILAPSDKITVNHGTMQFDAVLTPEKATPGVTWSVVGDDVEHIASIDENGLLTAINDGIVEVLCVSNADPTLQDSVNITITGQATPYWLHYDANTGDAVELMPEDDVWAKETYKLSNICPTRAKYNFVGWSLSDDGSTGLVNTVEMNKDVVVYAIWEDAVKWTFEREGDLMGFTSINGYHFKGLGHELQALATGMTEGTLEGALIVCSPEIAVDSSKYDYLVLLSTNSVIRPDTIMYLKVISTEGDYYYQLPVTSTNLTQYPFDISNVEGTITGFEITPTNIDCAFLIDEVGFSEGLTIEYDGNTTHKSLANVPNDGYTRTVSQDFPTRDNYTCIGWSLSPDSSLIVGSTLPDWVSTPTKLYAVWEKNDHWEFENLNGLSTQNISSIEAVDGILHYSTSHSDPIIHPTTGGFTTASTGGVLKIRMMYSCATDTRAQVQVFYQTSLSETTTEDKSQAYQFIPVDQWQVVELDFRKQKLSEAPSSYWGGTLKGMRWDLSDRLGDVYVDYIRFANAVCRVALKGGSDRVVSTDDAIYLVPNDVTIIPQGKTAFRGLALTGNIDMAKGYVTVPTDGTLEISEHADYVAFRPDAATLASTSYFRFNGCGIDAAAEDVFYILKTEDGFADVECYNATGSLINSFTVGSNEFIQEGNTVKIAYTADVAKVSGANTAALVCYEGNRIIGIKLVPVTDGVILPFTEKLTVDGTATAVKMIVLSTAKNALKPIRSAISFAEEPDSRRPRPIH